MQIGDHVAVKKGDQVLVLIAGFEELGVQVGEYMDWDGPGHRVLFSTIANPKNIRTHLLSDRPCWYWVAPEHLIPLPTNTSPEKIEMLKSIPGG